MSKPIAIDLFCGAGGLSLGFAQAGFRVAAALEMDKVHAEIHLKNLPHCEVIQKDAKLTTGQELLSSCGLDVGQLDVLIGGPPCQGFSMSGLRQKEDPRNRLILEFARLAKEMQPRYFVLENVDGLLMGEMRALLDEFIVHVQSSGFSVIQPVCVLDAADYGVPQRRKRAFVLGYRNDQPAPRYPTSAPITVTVEEALRDLLIVETNAHRISGDLYDGPLGVPSKYGLQLINARKFGSHAAHQGMSGWLRSCHTEKTVKRFADTPPGSTESVSRFFRLSLKSPSRTLRAGTARDRGSFTAPRPIHPLYPRCISVREAARLHSFPDWFQFHPTIWHGFREIGNSVPPLLSKTVAMTIMQALGGKP